jgi:hypothetical protein
MDDKKKIAILATLFIVMIGVGAFSFVKSGNTEQPVAAKETASADKTASAESAAPEGAEGQASKSEGEGKSEEVAKGEAEEAGIDPALIVAAKLDARDPFDGRKWDMSLQKPEPAVQPQPQQRQAPMRTPRQGSGLAGNGFAPLPIGQGNPNLPTVNPGADGKIIDLQDFQWSVSGTVEGGRPCAVFTDAAGKQKLVAVGGSIDNDSHLVSISKGKVTVSHRGKTKTFAVGGMTPSATKPEGN